MKTITYNITFYSYWHPGGKDGANMNYDNAVLKDKEGLPYIGGKTIKGLILDGARFVNKYHNKLVSDDFISKVFGEPDSSYSQENSGIIFNKFSSVQIPDKIDNSLKSFLFDNIQNTAIINNKQPKKHSLRTTEVVIPLTLIGKIENFTEDEQMLKYALQAVKKLGEKRTRGLGRCKITII